MHRYAVLVGWCIAAVVSFASAQEVPFTPEPRAQPTLLVSPLTAQPTAPPEKLDPVPPVVASPPVAAPNDLFSSLFGNRLTTPFATQTAGGGFQGRSFNEEFDGDLLGVLFNIKVQVGTITEQVVVGSRQDIVIDPVTRQPTLVTVPIVANVNRPVNRVVRVPVAGRYSGIMITDNDSPRPSDRLYFGYSYYDGIAASLNPGLGGVSLNREMAGFEKTFLDGNASIGLRLPFIQMNGPYGVGHDNVGDLSVLLKYAPYYNRETGNILSFGLVLTTPTGASGSFVLADGSELPHSVLFQPWVGGVRVFGRAYVQAISNMIIPTDGRDTLLIGNSIAMGYRLLDGNGALVPTVTPTFETHVRTPLNNRGQNSEIYFPDQVNLTSGTHFRWNRFSISGAVAVPVVGPRPWNIEALANINWRF